MALQCSEPPFQLDTRGTQSGLSFAARVWRAWAFAGRLRVCTDTVDEYMPVAMDKRRRMLDELLTVQRASRCDGFFGIEAYREWLSLIWDVLSDVPRSMLKAHARNPLSEPADLARAAGYAGFECVNLHYGEVGRALAQLLSISLPTRPVDGTYVWTFAVLSAGRYKEHDHFQWRMRPALVEAISELGHL